MTGIVKYLIRPTINYKDIQGVAIGCRKGMSFLNIQANLREQRGQLNSKHKESLLYFQTI